MPKRGVDKLTYHRYDEGSDLTVLHDKACPPKLPEQRRDGATCAGKGDNYVWRPWNSLDTDGSLYCVLDSWGWVERGRAVIGACPLFSPVVTR